MQPWEVVSSDEYVYHIPNPKHIPKYTKAKAPCTQDKHIQLSSFAELCCYCIKALLRLTCHVNILTTDWLPAPLRTRHDNDRVQ